jgi:hypothetical protein
MNVVIPPLVFYVVGAALVLGGTIRAFTLGRKNPTRELDDDDPRRVTARRRHLTFGVVWVLMGLFLIASTAGVLRSRAETTRVALPLAPPVAPRAAPLPSPGPSGTLGPTLRLSPAPPTTIRPPAAP